MLLSKNIVPDVIVAIGATFPVAFGANFKEVEVLKNVDIASAIQSEIPDRTHRGGRARDSSSRSDISSRTGTDLQNVWQRIRVTRDEKVSSGSPAHASQISAGGKSDTSPLSPTLLRHCIVFRRVRV